MRKIDLTDFQVATSETARAINRRIVLNLLRGQQPLSRADLARHSGLQRSTVSSIIEQLINERWVTEGVNGRTPRGRRPQFLHLNQERVGIIGVNIRPTLTAFGLANLDAQFLFRSSLKTATNPKQFIKDLSKCLQNLIKSHPEISYEGIGVSLPGRVDLTTQRLHFAPNLNWEEVDLKTPLEKATGLSVELENAANACALAEVWLGRHNESARNLIAVTVSEGIGVGIIVNGQLVHGSKGAAGEFGHVTLIENGLLCRCGNRGCWEMYASESAAVQYYLQTRKSSAANNESPDFEDILRLAEQGSSEALEALAQMAYHLGAGLAMLVTGLAPDVIVIVGELTRIWHQVAPIIEKTIKSRTFTHTAPRIFPTDPTSDPRLRGTIALVLQKHFGAPVTA